jgi:uncharacterized membrane protein YkvA (DUF1232 family)
VARTAQTASTSKRRSRTAGVGRLVGLTAFLPLASRAPDYARLIFALIADERTPASRKAVLAAALGYLVIGRDIVPDDIPIIGGLDDLVVVVLAVDLFLDGIPDELLREKLDELGIDRRAYAEDVVRIRRLMPGPVRRVLRRVPRLVEAAGDTLRRSGVLPQVRQWISKEDQIA